VLRGEGLEFRQQLRFGTAALLVFPEADPQLIALDFRGVHVVGFEFPEVDGIGCAFDLYLVLLDLLL
jgi:hypothetical protein